MAAQAPSPPHKIFESPNTRTILINSWLITASTNPISNAAQCDHLQSVLGFPLPEMTFGSNYLVLEHKPTGTVYSFRTGDALRAVRKGEMREGDGGVKVGYADKWLQSRTGASATLPMPQTVPTKPYDWTYTTTYQGNSYRSKEPLQHPTLLSTYSSSSSSSSSSTTTAERTHSPTPSEPSSPSPLDSRHLPGGFDFDSPFSPSPPDNAAASPSPSPSSPSPSPSQPSAPPPSSSSHQPLSWRPCDPEDPTHTIPLAELTRPDPILFYAEVPLFEDELHDNGASNLLVRIRVMPTCIFILARFTLRVDNVLFRTYDTRLYHSFSSFPSSPSSASSASSVSSVSSASTPPLTKPLFIRESTGYEAPYERIKKTLPKSDDLTPLTDPNYIAKSLSELPKHSAQRLGAKTGWKGLGTRNEYFVYEHINQQ